MYVERAMMLHVVPFDPMMDFLKMTPVPGLAAQMALDSPVKIATN
jgi:hypothetical protein